MALIGTRPVISQYVARENAYGILYAGNLYPYPSDTSYGYPVYRQTTTKRYSQYATAITDVINAGATLLGGYNLLTRAAAPTAGRQYVEISEEWVKEGTWATGV